MERCEYSAARARTDRWKVSPIGRPAHVFALEIALYLCRCEQRCKQRSLHRAKEADRGWGPNGRLWRGGVERLAVHRGSDTAMDGSGVGVQNCEVFIRCVPTKASASRCER